MLAVLRVHIKIGDAVDESDDGGGVWIIKEGGQRSTGNRFRYDTVRKR
jgi:hypothetical protein